MSRKQAIKILIVAFAVLAAFTSHAQDSRYPDTEAACKFVDMRPKMGPIRDQDGVGSCFAYAAANMISYVLGKRVSATDIYAQNAVAWKGRFEVFYGGLTDIAINASKMKGFCLEENFSDSDLGTPKDIATLLVDLEKNNWIGKIEYQDKPLFDKTGVYCSPNSSLKSLFPFQSIDQLTRDNKYVLNDLATQRIDIACAPRVHLKEDMWSVAASPTIENVEKNLNLDRPLMGSLNIINATEGQHAVTIAGRQWNKERGVCEYIVRNSWGKGTCTPIRSELRCDKDGDLYIDRKIFSKVFNELNTLITRPEMNEIMKAYQ